MQTPVDRDGGGGGNGGRGGEAPLPLPSLAFLSIPSSPSTLSFLLTAAILLALAAPGARAQLAEGGARALALGRAGTALEGEAWGEFNPATWAALGGGTADLFASQAFGLSELRVVALAAAYPTAFATLAGNARTYGGGDYRETRLGLGAARAVPLSATRRIGLGLQVQLHSVSIEGFGSSSTVTVSAGTQVEVLPGLTAGLHARNASRIGRSEEDDLDSPLSSAPALAVGLAYRAGGRALVALDAYKDLDFPLALRTGVEVQVVDALALRAGVQTGLDGSGEVPTTLSAGVGVRAGLLRADVAVERHEALGLTPAVSVGLLF
jgi:hypothetical protein